MLALLLPTAAAVMLIVAALGKALAYDMFLGAITAHGVIPTELLSFAWCVPVGEALIGVACLWRLGGGDAPMRSVLALAGVYAALAAYAAWMVFHPPAKPTGCGCGLSSVPVENWMPLVIRNAAVCCGLALTAAWIRTVPREAPNAQPPEPVVEIS